MGVLIIEDEFLITSLLEAIIESNAMKVSTVEQALAYAPRADIALVDLGLGDGNANADWVTTELDRKPRRGNRRRHLRQPRREWQQRGARLDRGRL